MKFNYKKFTEDFKRYKRRKDLTIKEMASESGLGNGTVQQLLYCNPTGVQTETFIRVCEYIGTDLNDYII